MGILDDHCYFLARPQKDIKPLKGMLTPNESSEDEDIFESQTASNFNTATTTTSNVNMVDKRKIAEAVQSLINNKPHGQNAGASANPNSTNNIKFKFRTHSSNLHHQNQHRVSSCTSVSTSNNSVLS